MSTEQTQVCRLATILRSSGSKSAPKGIASFVTDATLLSRVVEFVGSPSPIEQTIMHLRGVAVFLVIVFAYIGGIGSEK